ncbi:MAG: electron transfer flavoprotein subunit beta/FixA family protein [Gemmatimonadetes bacterium]|nr:electron transfer flavoprotein subunit beta/FixA family protein [Gemmatimonadota bacterium]NNM05596.1 electron transfer flavoprotein subunit beta/FixA family protein [Gemmatimonadota bacterium]
MKIVVCIKRTPDTETKIRLGGDGASIDPDGVKFIVSPYDEFAIEAALQLKETAGDGEVILLSMGGDDTQETLRQGLAMGADEAVLLKGNPGVDALATAKALSAELKGMGADLVLFGMKGADMDQQQVGPMAATLMDLPCATAVSEFDLEGERVTCRRDVEGGSEIIEMGLPAVITLTKGKYEPRYASLKGIMAAKRKPLSEKEAEPGESRLNVRDLSYPPERPAGRVVGEGPDAAPELVRLLREEAKAL